MQEILDEQPKAQRSAWRYPNDATTGSLGAAIENEKRVENVKERVGILTGSECRDATDTKCYHAQTDNP